MLKLPIRLTLIVLANERERMRAFLADGLDAAGAMPAQLTRPTSLPSADRGGHDAPGRRLPGATSQRTKRPPISAATRLALVGLQIGDDDLAAVLGEHARRAFAEAGGAAGDDEDLACDFHCCVSLMSVQASAASARAVISSTLPSAADACGRPARRRRPTPPSAGSTRPAAASGSGRPRAASAPSLPGRRRAGSAPRR